MLCAMTTHRYAAISFDAGYTLIQPRREAPAIVAELLAEQGIAPDTDTLDRAHHRAERLFLENYLQPLNDTWTADERIYAFYIRYYAQFLDDLGVRNPDHSHGSEIIRRYLDVSNWELYPDTAEALVTLHAAGYRMGVASDWNSGLSKILHAYGLSRYLDWAIVSGTIGFAKPSPQFYRLVAQRAHLPVDRIVHVGDSYYADVRGARTVGMDAVLLDRARRWPPLDVPIIHDLRELSATLAEAAPV